MEFDNSSDDEPPIFRRLRSRTRISSTSSSGSSIVPNANRFSTSRKRARISSTSSSECSSDHNSRGSQSSAMNSEDEISEREEGQAVPQVRTAATMRLMRSLASSRRSPQPNPAELSDSGDESAEKCPICLRMIRTQELGTPEGCDHTFCLACLVKWSQNCNKCPMDRQPFHIILVKESTQGPVTRKLEVEEKTLPFADFPTTDDLTCELCRSGDREERMLLCDGCDRGFHLECLTPPLDSVPQVDEWFCPRCVAWQQVTAEVAARAARAGQGSDSYDLGTGMARRTSRRASRNSRLFLQVRPAPRHRYISARIAVQMQASGERSPSPHADVLSNEPSTSSARPSGSVRTGKKVTKKKVKKRRKAVRRRYVVKKKKIRIENEDGTVTEETISVRSVVKRRKKRKVVRKTKKRRSAGPGRSSTARSRLSRALGMLPPTNPHQLLPEVSTKRLASPAVASNFSRMFSATPRLNIFEPRNELAPVSSGSDGEDTLDGPVGVLSRSRIRHSTRPLERQKALEILRSAPARPRIPPQQLVQPADLLSSILESQTIWHSKNSEVTIKDDGSVQVKPRLDVRKAEAERVTSAAPVFRGSGNRPYRPSFVGRPGPSYSQVRPEPSTSESQQGAAHNDREGYTNYFNNSNNNRPTPFWRGGPPLRFRMPMRPQLRRIPLLPRRPARTLYDEDDEVEQGLQRTNPQKKSGDEYSDVESNCEKEESDPKASYSVLGPPPEPPASLLNITLEDVEKPDEYDPAQPCDSDEETAAAAPSQEIPPLPNSPESSQQIRASVPIFSLYSADSLEYSRKGEEERARALAEKKVDLKNESVLVTPPPSSPKEDTGARLSFNAEMDESQESQMAENKSPTNAPAFPCPRKEAHEKSPTPKRDELSSRDDDSSDEDRSPRRNRLRRSSVLSSVSVVSSENGIVKERVSTGLEGLDVEQVSSEMEENDFNDLDKLSSVSLSGMSDKSRSSSPSMKRKKKKRRSKGKVKSKDDAGEDGEIGSDKEKGKKFDKGDRKAVDQGRKKKLSKSPNRSGSEENKPPKKESWRKPRKTRNYRENRKTSKERRRSASSSPKRDKKSKEKKKGEKKKELEIYDVRKVVKDKEMNRKDEFGRDLPSRKSVSKSRSRSRGRVRRTSRSPIRRLSKSPIRRRSPVRKISRSPVRRSSRSPIRRGRRRRSPSHSPEVSKKRKRRKSMDNRRLSRSRKRSLSRGRGDRSKPSRKSRSLSPRRSRRSVTPKRAHWSPGLAREPSIEKLTVVLTSKEKKKKKKKKEEKKNSDTKKKKSGNSKEVFASGDNVLVSVNFSKTNKNNPPPPVIIVPSSPAREVSKKKKRSVDESDKAKKSVNSSTKSAVDAALSAENAPKRKKLTRLNEQDAEEILNRKPVAVIDLDMSPYREQTPSPVNVVVVSDDERSGDEGKQRPCSTAASAPPAQPTYLNTGPKTPPEPSVKFSIAKPPLIRPLVNPLAEPEDEASEVVEEQVDILEKAPEVAHKGPNTPPEPRGPSTPPLGPVTPPRVGPSTPQSPPSSRSSPDAYDPFEPTKSRSASPVNDGGENSTDPPKSIGFIDSVNDSNITVPLLAPEDNVQPQPDQEVTVAEVSVVNSGTGEGASAKELSINVETTDSNYSKGSSIATRTTPQPMTPSSGPVFSLPSPKTPNRSSSMALGIQRLQHRLGSPVNRTPNSVKSTPEKMLSEPARKRFQETTNDNLEMDDSPYSPASSEGDDLFEPPPVIPVAAPSYRASKQKPTPSKAVNKFDLLFGSTAPNTSPLRNGAKKSVKPPKIVLTKADKKPVKGPIALKGNRMEEDQLKILDEVPSSAVELQVKDKFLKKLNRQERVVDEVKTVLKPHYAKKHITKEEYKDILRRAVPKICHSKSGEINPSKIQQLVEAYVRKYRHSKKESGGISQPHKLKKTAMFS